MATNSILRRMQRNLVRLGIAGALALGVFTIFDFDLFTAAGYHALGPWGVLHEMMDHLVFPLVVVFLPVMVVALYLTATGLEPLNRAAGRIDAATEEGRGTRVDIEGLPIEALPFVEAVNRLLDRRDRVAERSEAFAADIAHELKTPLAIMALELETSDAPIARTVLPEIRSLNRLIEQLLTLAQLDAMAAARQPFAPVALGDVAASVIALLAPAALRQGVRLALVEEARPSVAGRTELLRSALRNLVENAIRVTPHGGCVTIAIRADGVAVRDGGAGLSPAALDRLTRRFERADHASVGGAGLGLPIVARVADMHGARLTTDERQRTIALDFTAASSIASGV